MPSATHHILVFDSGIGGLSVVEQIRRRSPNVAIDYLADTAWFPYGLLDDLSLIARVTDLISHFVLTHQPDLVVIACNTASTLALKALRETLTVPMVGVVPAIKPAAAISQSKVIGLLATPGTIKRDYTEQLIRDFAPDCSVIRVGSNELVHWVEQKFRGQGDHQADIRELLAPLREHRGWPSLDTVVLACTHFPLALAELRAAAPEVRHWIDSGDAIARRVASLLAETPATSDQIKNHIYFTDKKNINDNLITNLLSFGFTDLIEFNR